MPRDCTAHPFWVRLGCTVHLVQGGSHTMNKQISASGLDWLVRALDPFHDFQGNCEGFPDIISIPSICQTVNKTISVSAPGITTWDCHIGFTGLDSYAGNIKLGDLDTGGGSVTVQSYDSSDYPSNMKKNAGSVIISRWESGDTRNPEDDNSVIHSRSSDTRGRMIACAIEVVNTTAPIYQQGNVMAAMLSDSIVDQGMCKYHDTAQSAYPDTAVQQLSGCKFPVTTSTLRTIPSSTSWAAKDGIYFIPRLCNHTITPNEPAYESRAHILTFEDSLRTLPNQYIDLNNNIGSLGLSKSSFAPGVILFSGLSAQTTLQVTFRTLVEYFPVVGSDLLPQSTPSAPFDPYALSVYSQVVAKAPYARPVKDNGSMDYLRMILSVIGDVAPSLLPLFPKIGIPLQVATIVSRAALKTLQGSKKKDMKVKPSNK